MTIVICVNILLKDIGLKTKIARLSRAGQHTNTNCGFGAAYFFLHSAKVSIILNIQSILLIYFHNNFI